MEYKKYIDADKLADAKRAAENAAHQAENDVEIESLHCDLQQACDTNRELQQALDKSNAKVASLEASEEALQERLAVVEANIGRLQSDLQTEKTARCELGGSSTT